jgi:hypothetical protein
MLLSSVKNRKKKEEANNPESAVPSDGRLRLPAPQVAVKYIEMISEALKKKYPLKVKGKPIEDLVANAHGYETAKDMVVGSQGSPSLTFFNQPFFERCADVMTALATVMKDLDNRASELEWALSRSVEIARRWASIIHGRWGSSHQKEWILGPSTISPPPCISCRISR